MKKCIVIPDSFKGTMRAIEVCDIMAERIRIYDPHCIIECKPIADGGEGTVDCFSRAIEGGKKITCNVHGPFGEIISVEYGRFGDVAVIEMAAAAGLNLAADRLNPMIASTFGVGELMVDAIQSGCDAIILGMGGTATNDAGTGIIAAMGTTFYNKDDKAFLPSGGTLSEISRIDHTATDVLIRNVTIRAMYDVNNPMFGENGAAFIFGPQKGATPEMLPILDRNLRAFADFIQKERNINIGNVPGSGAAGAAGAGVYAFLNGTLSPGIDVVMDIIGFEHLLDDCDAVFTGEGRLDLQSLGGKAVVGIARRAMKKKVPVIAIVGSCEGVFEDNPALLIENGITKVYVTADPVKSKEQQLLQCRADLAYTMNMVLSDINSSPASVLSCDHIFSNHWSSEKRPHA